MVHSVKSPKERNFVIYPMPPIHPAIKEQECQGGMDGNWEIYPVQNADTMSSRPLHRSYDQQYIEVDAKQPVYAGDKEVPEVMSPLPTPLFEIWNDPFKSGKKSEADN